MKPMQMDTNLELMLDGNALAGMLYDVFGAEMTSTPAECASCGNVAEMGALLAFTHAPGMVLRCPTCESIVLRMVETPDAIYLDARGAVYLRMAKRSA
jgi:hypothetical protein